MIDTSFDTSQLDQFKQNHRDNSNFPREETKAAVIELDHLQSFIDQARSKSGCDAVKIYFIRYDLTADQDHIKKMPNGNVSQLSLAFVPARITSRVDWTADDLDENNNILTLLICKPVTATRSRDDMTGTCPPKPPGACQ